MCATLPVCGGKAVTDQAERECVSPRLSARAELHSASSSQRQQDKLVLGATSALYKNTCHCLGVLGVIWADSCVI